MPTFTKRRSSFLHKRSGSLSSQSDEGSHHENHHHRRKNIAPPVLVYHTSARSIVFRDHLRRAASTDGPVAALEQRTGKIALEEFLDDASEDFVLPLSSTKPPFDAGSAVGVPKEDGAQNIEGLTVKVTPLEPMDFGPDDTFEPLVKQAPPYETPPPDLTDAEAEVMELFQNQKCAVKTIKNNEWGSFLHRFNHPETKRGRRPNEHDDIGPDHHEGQEHQSQYYPFNSFVTSTSLLPANGRKMKCYGSTTQYTVGVVFSLPDYSNRKETEDEAAKRTQTWAWPAGYSAKTEFNIDGRGKLINGRQEALVPLSVLRSYNNDYLTKESYQLGSRVVHNSGSSQIPYNEVYLRIGGVGRLVRGVDRATGAAGEWTLDRGVGLPVALFVRSATYGSLISLLRARARIMHVLGDHHFKGIPLLLVTPELGVRVLTDSLQKELWKIAAQKLNPFQNQAIAYKTTLQNTHEESFQQKVEELIDLDETIQGVLTPEELGRVAGGFGATDESVAAILREAVVHDRNNKNKTAQNESNHRLQDIVNEGLASALRSGDYHTSRQLLILYSVVASSPEAQHEDEHSDHDEFGNHERRVEKQRRKLIKRLSSLGRDSESMKKDLALVRRRASMDEDTLSNHRVPAPPPPPPLDTDRLRSATNSDGLLAVLGAAQVFKAMQDGGAKKRTQEVIDAVDEWVNYGEQSVAFRISSWYDQRAAQDDLKIATEKNSKFMAFVSNKAIANRKAFAQHLREAADVTDFTDMRFLEALDAMLKKMNSPCLRLELLQYVLGLDNRYSVAHVERSVELAAMCLEISLSVR